MYLIILQLIWKTNKSNCRWSDLNYMDVSIPCKSNLERKGTSVGCEIQQKSHHTDETQIRKLIPPLELYCDTLPADNYLNDISIGCTLHYIDLTIEQFYFQNTRKNIRYICMIYSIWFWSFFVLHDILLSFPEDSESNIFELLSDADHHYKYDN